MAAVCCWVGRAVKHPLFRRRFERRRKEKGEGEEGNEEFKRKEAKEKRGSRWRRDVVLLRGWAVWRKDLFTADDLHDNTWQRQDYQEKENKIISVVFGIESTFNRTKEVLVKFRDKGRNSLNKKEGWWWRPRRGVEACVGKGNLV
jgi:hypothetical protein